MTIKDVLAVLAVIPMALLVLLFVAAVATAFPALMVGIVIMFAGLWGLEHLGI